jgi:hypothetical protein
MERVRAYDGCRPSSGLHPALRIPAERGDGGQPKRAAPIVLARTLGGDVLSDPTRAFDSTVSVNDLALSDGRVTVGGDSLWTAKLSPPLRVSSRMVRATRLNGGNEID